ncbi:MAG: cytochrome c [Methylocystis sp.]|uniref:cytochrome c n=1 Tax=Methylocystis sp. TaxID=1911079 RepID=UPI003DA301B0
MWRWSARLAAVLLIAVAAYGIFVALCGVPSVANHPLSRDSATIASGKYLAAAGDCASCHTAKGGEAFAGGRPLATPFGTIYSANITPDLKTGIGDLSSAQFYQLMAYGADSLLAPLYPAMPYTSFHNLTREDSDALFAYFMSVPAVERPVTPNEMSFPFNIRPLMFGWDFLFASRRPFKKNPDKDAAWNRGAYLVEGLGHCGECHTPRNVLGAMEGNRALDGAVIGAFKAPDITAAALAKRGWNREDLVLYFETGASPQGSAFGDMFLAVKKSLRLLTDDDRMAIATFLMDVDASATSKGEAAVAALGEKAHENRSGQTLFLSYCSLCHGPDGQGVQSTMPRLAGNATLAEPDGVNLIEVMAYGIDPDRMSLTRGYGPMPAFRNRLSAAQMADLANYVRSVFAVNGNALPVLSVEDVDKILQ